MWVWLGGGNVFIKEGASAVTYKCVVFTIHLMLPKRMCIFGNHSLKNILVSYTCESVTFYDWR